MIVVPQIREVRIGQRGFTVAISMGGQDLMQMPWKQALEVAAAIYEKAKVAESYERLHREKEREELYQDQSLLLKAGFPINLGVPKDELPKLGPLPTIKGKPAVFGKPSMTVHPPPEE